MDELLVPEISMEVDDQPADITETIENGASNSDSENNVSDLNNEVIEVPSEEQNGEIISVSPDLDEEIPVPHSEQNGEIVELDDDDSNHNETNTEVVSVEAVIENHKSPPEVVVDSEQTAQDIGDDQAIPFLNCDTTRTENSTPVDSLDSNSRDGSLQTRKYNRYLLPSQIPNDYTPEELEVYNSMFARGNQLVQFTRLHCTACNVHLGSSPNKQYRRFIHPLLRVLICKSCYEFYGSGEFDKDEDGSELYCRWCGQGGKVLCCAKCPFVFCQRCIRCNMGKEKLQAVLDSEDWLCFECVPEQTIKLRVIVRALYDFVQSEINIASEMDQPERLKSDHSLCCSNRIKAPKIKIKLPALKRKSVASLDNDVVKDDNTHTKRKKIKLKTLSSLLTMPKQNNISSQGGTFINPLALSTRVWESQTEDEVVCTPDLALLMPMADEEEEPSGTSQQSGCPPLTPITKPNKNNFQFVNRYTPIRPALPKELGYKIPKSALILNASTARPLLSKTLNSVTKLPPNLTPVRFPSLSQPLISINQQNRITAKVPSQIVPGTHYEWFEKASQAAIRVSSNLSTRLGTLTNEQNTVSSLEGLATIHNNFQEILNNSIKTLTQIRKNLRNDFIAGLKTLKYDSSETVETPQTKNTTNDDDVIIVDSPVPTPEIVVPSTSSIPGRLKLKPVSALIIDSAVITIPDDALEPSPPREVEVVKVVESQTPIPVEKVKTPLPETTAAGQEFIEEGLNPETRALIRRALQESKLETLINENLKLHVPNEISIELFKRMVSVRVIVENKFGTATPRMRPRHGYVPMNIRKFDEDDIENMLSSSIVLNISKNKLFNIDSVDEQPVLTINDEEVEYLSNGML